jgi:hypothetical protein
MRTNLSDWRTDDPPLSHEHGSQDKLERLERDLKAVTDALGLLGVKRCSHCLQFFRCSEPGALFDFGQLVCFGCIRDWWSAYSGTTNVQEREAIERKLSAWLRKYHQAEVVKEGAEKQCESVDFKIVTSCSECRGSGQLLEGQRCRFCNGLGTVWIVVPTQSQ